MVAAAKHTATIFSTPSDLEVVMTRVFEAPLRMVWDAFTNPKHVPHWMTGPEGWTMPVCEIDLRPGGSWHFVWRKSDGSEMAMRGAYHDVVPLQRVVSTESWGDPWPETVNTLAFSEAGGKTTVTTTIRYPSKAARDAALGTGMKDGADQSYNRLEGYLRRIS